MVLSELLVFMLRRNFWTVNCDSGVFLVWHHSQWIPAAQLSGSQWVTRLSCYHVSSGLSIVIGMFFGLPPLAVTVGRTIEWLSVIYSFFMLRRNFWFFNFGRDIFMLCHLWQWTPAAQLSGSHWVNHFSWYEVIPWISIVIGMFSRSDTFDSDYLQRNWLALS